MSCVEFCGHKLSVWFCSSVKRFGGAESHGQLEAPKSGSTLRVVRPSDSEEGILVPRLPPVASRRRNPKLRPQKQKPLQEVGGQPLCPPCPPPARSKTSSLDNLPRQLQRRPPRPSC